MPEFLSPLVVEGVKSALGVTKLYSHQKESLEKVFEGKHIVVSTSTSR